MTEQELKACPFCGGSAEIAYNTSSDYKRHWYYYAYCVLCDCELAGSRTEAEAIAAWNTRAERKEDHEQR